MSFTDFSLFVSLVFGAGQCIFGVAVIVHGLRAGRWRRTGIFLLVVLGAWAMCSGAAELLVSGMAVAARSYGAPALSQVDAVRHVADAALVAVSVALLLPLAAFSVWKRAQTANAQPHKVTGQKD